VTRQLGDHDDLGNRVGRDDEHGNGEQHAKMASPIHYGGRIRLGAGCWPV
jgi:hypothetical protein